MDYQCDLYCYESDEGFETIVAGLKLAETPPHQDWFPEMLSDDWWKRHNDISEFMKTVKRVPIGLKHDGESYVDDTLEEFRDRLIMLKEAGYRFPYELIDEIQKEMQEAL